jgi:hypothetical protein
MSTALKGLILTSCLREEGEETVGVTLNHSY